VIERNLIVGNREGFNFREQTRTTPRIGDPKEVPVWNHDELVRHNIIVLNRDAQIWGWFDIKDNRHWPAAARKEVNSATVARSAEQAAQSQALTLEQLRLRFQANVYFAAPGQGWFEWGVTWGRHTSYPNLAEFAGELGIDEGSQAIDLGFSNLVARDYRITQETMNRVQENYPHGPVPDVILGVQP
jgi:hypothetical protein